MIFRTCILRAVSFGALLFITISTSLSAQTLSAISEAELTRLINAGAYGNARIYLDTLPHDRSEDLLLEARILKSKGDVAGAIPILREALQAAPKDLRIRRELAHTLYLDKQYGPAQHHLSLLKQRDPSPALRAGYYALSRQIDTDRPLSFSGFVELRPSTNINLGSSYRYLTNTIWTGKIADESRAQSGTGLRFGGTGVYRIPVSNGRKVELRFGIERTSYSQNDTLNYTIARTELRYISTHTRYENILTPFVQRSWRGDERDAWMVGLRWRQRFALTAKNRLTYWVSRSHHSFLDADYDYNDGWRSSGGLHFFRSVTPSFGWGASIEANWVRPEIEHNRYRGVSVAGHLEKDWKGGTITRMSVYRAVRDFEGNAPLAVFSREDDLWGVSITVQPTQLSVFGLSPILSCDHVNNASNLSLYSYEKSSCGLRLTRNF